MTMAHPNRVDRIKAIQRLWSALEAQMPVLSAATIEWLARMVEQLQPERARDRAA